MSARKDVTGVVTMMYRGSNPRLTAALAVTLISACGGNFPAALSDWPDLESCNQGSETIYMPAEQGPSDAVSASYAAIDCILDAHEAGTSRQADFVLLGTEGDEFRLIVQTLDNETINLYWGTDTTEIYEGCETLDFDGVFFFAKDC